MGSRTTMGKASASTEGGEILRRRKEMLEAYKAEDASGLLSMKLTLAEPEKAGAEEMTKRKRKVIKTRLPQEVIDYMIATPHPIIGEEPTDDELDKHHELFRDTYARAKFTSEKVRAYYQAIIDQYNAKGYAEDEGEVTDDDEEEETVEN